MDLLYGRWAHLRQGYTSRDNANESEAPQDRSQPVNEISSTPLSGVNAGDQVISTCHSDHASSPQNSADPNSTRTFPVVNVTNPWPNHLCVPQAPTVETKATITAHLQDILNSFVAISNSHDISSTNPNYVAHMDPGFQGYLDPPWPATPFTLEEFLERSTQKIRQFPEYREVVTGFQMGIDERWGTARVFMNKDVMGMPSGVKRKMTCLFLFRRSLVDGVWRCYMTRTLEGSGTLRMASMMSDF